MVYQLCDGKKTVTEISQILTLTSKQSITEDLIWLALDGFKKDNLLEQSEQYEINFNGLSRRQVIKKIGFASMLALPVIASVVAPSAATAASVLLANNSACTTNPQCQSNNCFGGSTCCASGTTSANSPGTVINNCNFAISCDNVLRSQCCSGNTTFTVTDCSAPNPGSGSCACAP